MTALVNPETGEKVEAVLLLTREEALDVTLKIKQYAGMFCHLVKKAHDGGAWRVLGYPSWAAYCAAEFDVSRSYSYRLIAHAEKIMELSAAAGLPEVSPIGDIAEGFTRKLDVPAAKAAIADAVADLPNDATDEDRARVASSAVRDLGEPEQAPPPPAPAEPSTPQPAAPPQAQGVEGDAGGSEVPATSAPGVSPIDASPALEAAAQRERIGKAMAKVSDLLALDPTEAAEVMHPDDNAVWCETVDDLADWCRRFTTSVVSTRHLRSVQ